MAFTMTRPTRRTDSRNLQFQARVPQDLASKLNGKGMVIHLPGETPGSEAIAVSIQLGTHAKFSLRTSDPKVAKLRTSVANQQLAEFYQAHREGPRPLTHKEAVGLSGEIYRLFVTNFEENPGPPTLWAAIKGFNRAVSEGRIEVAPRLDGHTVANHLKAAEGFGDDLTSGINALSQSPEAVAGALEKRFGWLADWVLTKHRITTDADSRAGLLLQVEKAATDAAWQLKRNAQGDYTPDPKAARFPPVEPPRLQPTDTTFEKLFEAWADPKFRAAETIRRWRHVVLKQFPDFIRDRLGHTDPARVTKADVVAWRDALLRGGTSARTVKGASIAAISAVYAKAVADDVLRANPAKGVTVESERTPELRSKAFTNEEAKCILKAATGLQQGRRTAERFAALRWSPLIACYTGARISEIVQLRKADFFEVDGDWTLRITPEAGGVKNNRMRQFPVPMALIDAGLRAFVESRSAGPLFLDGEFTPGKRKDAARAVASFIRSDVGITDKGVDPNHGWRHRFATVARAVGMSMEHREYILGHHSDAISRVYGDMVGLRREIDKLPCGPLD